MLLDELRSGSQGAHHHGRRNQLTIRRLRHSLYNESLRIDSAARLANYSKRQLQADRQFRSLHFFLNQPRNHGLICVLARICDPTDLIFLRSVPRPLVRALRDSPEFDEEPLRNKILARSFSSRDIGCIKSMGG